MARPIFHFSGWIFTTYLKRTCNCTPKHPFVPFVFCFFFHASFKVIFFFFTDLWKKKRARKGWHLKCWLVQEHHVKNHLKMRIIERDIAKSIVLAARCLAQLVVWLWFFICVMIILRRMGNLFHCIRGFPYSQRRNIRLHCCYWCVDLVLVFSHKWTPWALQRISFDKLLGNSMGFFLRITHRTDHGSILYPIY